VDSSGYPNTKWKDFAYVAGEVTPSAETVFTFAGIRFRIPLQSDPSELQDGIIAIDNGKINIRRQPVSTGSEYGQFNLRFGDTVMCQLQLIITKPSSAANTRTYMTYVQDMKTEWLDPKPSEFVEDWSTHLK
jgi:hypothetical protein